jgi:hypothetical protein
MTLIIRIFGILAAFVLGLFLLLCAAICYIPCTAPHHVRRWMFLYRRYIAELPAQNTRKNL